jgi:hypothetical protein
MPAKSSASIVFSKVGVVLLVMISLISFLASLIAFVMAGRKSLISILENGAV